MIVHAKWEQPNLSTDAGRRDVCEARLAKDYPHVSPGVRYRVARRLVAQGWVPEFERFPLTMQRLGMAFDQAIVGISHLADAFRIAFTEREKPKRKR